MDTQKNSSKWVKSGDSLPDDFEIVITQLFNGNIVVNSIQHRNHPDASGNLINIREWTNKNIYVVNWLSIPKPPILSSNKQ